MESHFHLEQGDIIINNFMFCAPHGFEQCNACGCDYRIMNNMQIEQVLIPMANTFAKANFDIEASLPIRFARKAFITELRSSTETFAD
jgi:hypothetical protein